ncbi:MAG: protein kinase [Candidatus Zixiibacteriota bacterium]|nr:MAG: protein kinase [candidate division Zixibacteria bacterium]
MILESGKKFGHFTIVRKLGEGGMGEVYLAEDERLNRKVALKILSAQFFDDPGRRARFIREAKTAARISHPNVMAIHDLDTAREEKSGRELSYIVMEHVTGRTLTEYLQKDSLSMAELLRISEKIAAGLAAAHKLSIVHRDIKTDNVKLDENGDPKILDFGLAKPIDLAPAQKDADVTDSISNDLTQEGKILGTVTYMSPEQARGEPVDTRSDIFSFGVLMYRMFTGEFPFGGTDKVSILAKILETRHAPMRQKNESLPPELERIVDKCLQKNPDDRYQDTRDLVVDLRTLRRQYESAISDTTTVGADVTGKKSGRRSSFLSGPRVGLITVLILVIAAVLYRYVLFPAAPGSTAGLQARENALAILGFENKTGDEDLSWLQAGLPEILLTDLAQNGVMNVISRNRVLDCLDEPPGSIHDLGSYQECVAAAKSLGASAVLSGSFYKMGEMIRIDARLENIESGQILLGEKVVGSDPFVLVDSLTRKIAQSLNIKELAFEHKGVSDVTSSSSEAYKYYILGMEKFSLSLFDEAIEHFEKAIEIDSTFALPYMRIGMAHTFRLRGQQGSPYFVKALQFEDKLPIKEKSMLDIYADIWLRVKFDEATVKIQTYVSNYPDDKEGRTIYALILNELLRDSTASLAQLDTVMMLDPEYQFALSAYVEFYRGTGDYEKSIEYTNLIKKYYPESPEPYLGLALLYYSLSQYDEAIRESREVLQKFPDNSNGPTILVSCYVMKREFDSARVYNELLKNRHPDDPYLLTTYYRNASNLSFWSGKFNTGMAHLKRAAKLALAEGDSVLIFNQLNSISGYYSRFGMTDSAVAYAESAYQWSTRFSSLDYPLQLIKSDIKNEAKARPIFEEALNNFKSRLPSELWPLGDLIQDRFNAYAKNDTAGNIAAMRELIKNYSQESSSHRNELGILLVLHGQYDEGKEVLLEQTSGQHRTGRGFYHLTAVYYIGRANEALGNTEEAIENYRELLNYWGDPEIDLREIKDARERLNRLVS